jgi:hypothetical protein
VFDRSILGRCRKEKDVVLPGLLDAMRTRGGRAKEHAAIMLLQVGDARGTQGIVDILERGSDAERIDVLAAVSALPCAEPSGKWAGAMDPPVPMNRDRLVTALLVAANRAGHRASARCARRDGRARTRPRHEAGRREQHSRARAR